MGFEPREPRARNAIDDGKHTANEHFAIALESDRINGAVRAGQPSAESGVHRSIAIETRDGAARRAGDHRKTSGNDDLAVALPGDGLHRPIKGGARIESKVNSAHRGGDQQGY